MAKAHRRSWWLAALVGVVTAAAGMAAAHALAAIANPTASPLLAVGAATIDLTPTWLKELAVARFGTADKPILLGSIGLVVVILAASIGVVARRRPSLATALIAVVGVVVATAVVTRPTNGTADLLASLAGLAVWAITLRWLTSASQPANRTPAEADPDAAPGAGAPRRAVLLGILALGAGAALVGAAGTFIGNRVRGDIDALRRTLRLPTPSEPAAPLDPNVQVPVDGVSEFRTRNDDFYRVDTALIVPNVDPQSWTLTVLGMVREPYTLSFDDLLAMPMIERDITLTCVSNEVGGPYVGTARWLGVPLRSLLTRAGVDRAADQLLSRSADGFTAGTPMPIALDFRDAMVAVGMNGEPLPVQHGFPARLVIPGLYGFVSATKWLVELKATTYAAEQAYWTRRGWATDAPIRTMARVEVPRPLSSVRSGTTAIAGTAWAQHRGIEGVEVQVDGGAWEPARLGSVPSADTWRQWWLPWNATPGRHVIRARATDSEGRTQPEARLTPFPSGAQGWHEVVVTVS